MYHRVNLYDYCSKSVIMSEKRFLEESRTPSEASKFRSNGEYGESEYLNSIYISSIYQSLHMFEPGKLAPGAQEESRTPMFLRTLAPEASASTIPPLGQSMIHSNKGRQT